METVVQVPKAFSVRDFHEFQAHQDLLLRMNPKIRVKKVATGRHKNGGSTVFWGIVYLDGEKIDEPSARGILEEAGLDMTAHPSIMLNGISI